MSPVILRIWPIRHNDGMDELDILVGKIAGAIYSDVSRVFPHPPLMLVPAVTFKVRKKMEQITELNQLPLDQISTLAKDIQISIIPMLFSYEIDPDTIEKISPVIENAAYRAIIDAVQLGSQP